MRFLQRTLGVLDRVYRFEGPQTSMDRFDLAAQLQPVHDVSREAETGTLGPFSGFVDVSSGASHGALTTSTNSSTIEAMSLWTRIGADPDRCWLWLRETTYLCSDSLTLVEATLSLTQTDNLSNFQGHRRTLAIWDGLTRNVIATNVKGGIYSGGQPKQVLFPVLIPPGTTVLGTSEVSAAVGGTAWVIDLQFQVTPRGVAPFGAF